MLNMRSEIGWYQVKGKRYFQTYNVEMRSSREDWSALCSNLRACLSQCQWKLLCLDVANNFRILMKSCPVVIPPLLPPLIRRVLSFVSACVLDEKLRSFEVLFIYLQPNVSWQVEEPKRVWYLSLHSDLIR